MKTADNLKRLIDRIYKISMPVNRLEKEYYEATFEAIYGEIKSMMSNSAIDKKWDSFDKVMQDFGNSFDKEAPREMKDELKCKVLGREVMTDAQHRKIIALFTNELGWTANSAFLFTVKVLPALKQRLPKRVINETDIQGLYQALNKKEASKLIDILKSISKRKKCVR